MRPRDLDARPGLGPGEGRVEPALRLRDSWLSTLDRIGQGFVAPSGESGEW